MEASNIPTQTALARALSVHKSTIARYLRREDFPVNSVPPWTAADVATLRAWQDETLQPDRSNKGRQDDAFYQQFSYRGSWRIRVAMREDVPELIHADPLKQPVEICSEAERAILEDRVKPTPAQVRELVAKTVRLKALMVHLCETLPPWLVGQECEEVKRRARAAVYEKLSWHQAAVAFAMGEASE